MGKAQSAVPTMSASIFDLDGGHAPLCPPYGIALAAPLFPKLRMPLRIDQPVDPQRRRHGEPHRHLLARGRSELVLGRLALQVRTIGIRDDQAGILRKDLARQVLREGEEQPVAMRPVFVPFLIGAQILHRRFDLDDPDLAAFVQRDEIGASPPRAAAIR
ncbi:hypothetical protein ACVWXM_003515 [Bradyrhizobium sp. GM7.3]